MVEETAAPAPGAVEAGAPGQPGQPDGGVDLTDYRLKVENGSHNYINLISKL